MGRFEVKNFSYSLFKGKHCMESKIIEYGIILLHKYKLQQAEVNLHFPNIFSYFLYSSDIRSLENIHPITY